MDHIDNRSITSIIDEDIILVDKDKSIVEVSEGVDDIFDQSILNKHLSELEISKFLDDLINDNLCLTKEYPKLNVLKTDFLNSKKKLLVSFNNNYITIFSKEYGDMNILVLNKIENPNFTNRHKQLFENNCELVAEVHDKNSIPLHYISQNIDKDLNDVNLLDIVHSADVEVLRRSLSRCLENQEDSDINIRIKLDDSWLLYNIKVLSLSDEPQIKNPVITGINKNDQYLFEQRRLVMNRILRHDLRNGMNVIRGYASSISEDNNQDQMTRDFAEKIKSKSDSLMSISDEVRKIDKELNKVNRKLRTIDLNCTINDLVNEIHNDNPQTSFRVSLPNNLNINGNTLVKTCFREVIENAIEHNKDDVEVCINGYEKSDDKIVIEIIDNGYGIDKGEIDAIKTGVEKPLNHVSGLGLWMVKWIINVVDGELEIDNLNDQTGTKVTMTFHIDSVDKDKMDSDYNNVISSLNSVRKMNSDTTIGTSTRD